MTLISFYNMNAIDEDRKHKKRLKNFRFISQMIIFDNISTTLYLNKYIMLTKEYKSNSDALYFHTNVFCTFLPSK